MLLASGLELGSCFLAPLLPTGLTHELSSANAVTVTKITITAYTKH